MRSRWLAVLLLSGCASEASEEIRVELVELEARSREGVDKVERALADPTLTFAELGDGVRIVEASARELARLEADHRAGETQRVMAVVLQARAWDDVALAFVQARPPPVLDAAQERLFEEVLAEKAMPARGAAAESYQRALDLACQAGMQDHPAMLEILDGVQRYRGDATPVSAPCLD